MTIYVNNLLSATAADVTGKPTPTRAWQWLRNGTAISGANSSTYTVVEADLAANLSVSQIETNLGGIDTATSTALGPVSIFGVNSLFANDEEGAWYAPSDLSTLFQDSAGTTPVTTAGQPVGLMLDKSKGLVLGVELTTNGNFATASDWTLAADTQISGGNLSTTTTVAGEIAAQVVSIEAGKTYKIQYTVLSTNGEIIVPRLSGQSGSSGPASTTTGTFTGYILAVSDINKFAFNVSSSGLTATISDVSVQELPGNHATQSTAAARPTYQTGAGLHWLAFDGVDDAMATGVVDFTGTSKTDVFCGVYKESDAGLGAIVMNGTNGNEGGGTFALYAPHNNTSRKWAWSVSGTGQNFLSVNDLAAPSTVIMSGLFDISNALGATGRIKARLNGAEQTVFNDNINGGSASAMKSDTIRIGVQETGSGHFYGRLYGLIIRGAQSTASQINETETYMAARTGVTL